MTDSNSNRPHADRKLLTRLFSKIQVSTENFYKGVPCWEWQASTTAGYGMVKYGRVNRLSHVVLYLLFVGEIPSGLVCDHLCRNTRCCNPVHIDPVTQRVNVIDRGVTNASAVNARKTHCKSGHEFTPENTMSAGGPDGKYRRCRACFRASIVEKEKRGYDKLMSLPYDHPRRVARRATAKRAQQAFHARRKLLAE